VTLPVKRPLPPMEAATGDARPGDAGWQYEPKWDGFRGVVFRDGDAVAIQSKAGEVLERYFPELVEAFAALRAKQFVLDGRGGYRLDRRAGDCRRALCRADAAGDHG